MKSESRRRKKLERRNKRREKRRERTEVHKARLESVTCHNCGELFGLANDPDVVHRPGPCDATPEIMQEMERILDARAAAYAASPDGKIACPNCGTKHGEGDQATHFFEGRLVWDGCDHCLEAQSAKFERIRQDHYEKWFGVKMPYVRPSVDEKYVPHRVTPLN